MGIRVLLAAVLLCLAAEMASAGDWPVIATPKGSRLSVVSENMAFNGVPMKMWEMVASSKHEEVLSFYRNEWKRPAIKGAPGFTEYELGEWKVISRLDEDYLITVQVMDEPPGRSVALIAMSTLPVAEDLPVPGRGFPTLGDSTILNDIVAKDGSKESRTILAKNNRPVVENIDFYRRTFRRKGWIELTGNEEPHKNAGALIFDKKNRELNLTVTKADTGTSIVAVFVTN